MPRLLARLYLGALATACCISARAETTTVDFDDQVPGTPVQVISQVAFSSNIVGFNLAISTGEPTTSAPNYLGVADGFTELFLPGDVVTLDLSGLSIDVRSVRATFISTFGADDGAFYVSANGETVMSGSPDAVIGDAHDEVYTLTISSDLDIFSVEIGSQNGFFAFSLDDIVVSTDSIATATVPIPTEYIFLGSCLLTIVRRRVSRFQDQNL